MVVSVNMTIQNVMLVMPPAVSLSSGRVKMSKLKTKLVIEG